MFLGGITLVPGLFVISSALAIAGSMAYAIIFIGGDGGVYIPSEPYELPEGDHVGPFGSGEPACWENAAMYVAIFFVLFAAGVSRFSLDELWVRPFLQAL